MGSSVLDQNADSTVILLDIPRSIELARGHSTARLLSSEPLKHPYPSVEPKSTKARASLGDVSLDGLLLQKYLEFALDELRGVHEGEWCLPRITEQRSGLDEVLDLGKKRKREVLEDEGGGEDEGGEKRTRQVAAKKRNQEMEAVVHLYGDPKDGGFVFHNPHPTSISIGYGPDGQSASIPPKATALCGDISSTTDTFLQSSPKFDLIILDPPWPNRSARRKKSYVISYGTTEIRELLISLPLEDKLVEGGMIAVWVTNKDIFREMVVGDGGLFESWNVRLVEEWIWLKVTASGEPICALDSAWRKPYEVLLIGERGGGMGEGARRRVIVGVSDLHSRKPNLKELFETMIGKVNDKYQALEVFARNLTAGWWGWGNQVLKFQMEEHWVDNPDLAEHKD